jgi:glycosyltransferase involved in cell wall biosynthesis
VKSFSRKFSFHADLIRLLAENIHDADVYISTWYTTSLALWFAVVEGKKFYFLQDFPELVFESGGVFGLKMFDLTLRVPFDKFLCNSSYTRDLLLERQPKAKTIITGVGVDTQVFRPYDDKIIDAEGKNIVMVIVRGAKFKGDEVAVNTLNIVAQKQLLKVIIIGKNVFVNQLFKLIKPQFAYEVFEDVGDYMLGKLYSSADVFLFTSHAESFGLPPLEAMACGTPVVTTDCKGNRDYAFNEVKSLVVPPGNVKLAAEAVLRILTENNLRRKLVKEGLKTAKQWNRNKVVDKFEQAIREE